MIVDASVLLHAFLPDELHPAAIWIVREHVARRLELKAPSLLLYELGNAVWQAERRGRITREQAEQAIQAFAGLEIELIPLDWGAMLPLARRFQCSAYDAAYLTLAEQLDEPFVTADSRLYNAVHPALDWVLWLGDYSHD